MPPLCVPKWYLAVIGAVAVQRLGELYVSRSNEARIRGVRAASSTYPLRVLAHVGLVTLPLVRSRGLSRASARVSQKAHITNVPSPPVIPSFVCLTS
jgi:hypothetical protein